MPLPNPGREGASRPRVAGLPQRVQAFPWTQVAAGNHLADPLMPELRALIMSWGLASAPSLPTSLLGPRHLARLQPLSPGFPGQPHLSLALALFSPYLPSLSGTPNFLSHPQRAPLASSGKHVSSLGTKRVIRVSEVYGCFLRGRGLFRVTVSVGSTYRRAPASARCARASRGGEGCSFFCRALAGDAVETSSAWLPKDGFLVSSLVSCTHTDDRQDPSQNLRVSPALVRDPVGPQAPSAGVAWRTGVPANGNARH